MKQAYYIEFSAVYFDEEARTNRERGLDMIFDSENRNTAIVDGIKWALGRKKAFPDLYRKIGCIKIGDYIIENVDKDTGYCKTKANIFYEWKYDTSPRNIEEEFEFQTKQQRGNKD